MNTDLTRGLGRAMMKERTRAMPVLVASLLLAGMAGIAGCSGHHDAPTVQTVMVPPLVDLKQHELIGVVEFSSKTAKELAPAATRRFIESARHDQGLVRFVPVGTRAQALRLVGRDRWDPETWQALGEKLGLKTILSGELTISDIRPDVRLFASLRSGEISAQVDATLTADLIEVSTGASLWSASAGATSSVGHISVLGGRRFAFDASNPDQAYGGMIDGLVEQATRDFHATWERR